jgi:hypothetical protein
LIFQQKDIDSSIIDLTKSQKDEIQKLTTGTCNIHVLGRDYLDKVSIHLRGYQMEYCKKRGDQDLSLDLMKRYPKSEQTLAQILY